MVYLILLYTCVIFCIGSIIIGLFKCSYNIYCFLDNIFIILCFISRIKLVFILAKRHTPIQNRWAIAPILQEELNMLNLPCKTVQDYPARLHASFCATLQHVGYLARYCMQYVARYLALSIASCRQAFTGGLT